MHMRMTVEIFIAIMVVKRSDGAIEIERSSAAVYVGWAWSGFFVVVVVVVHTPTDYIEGLFRVVSQFNITARILNVLHATKEICLIL